MVEALITALIVIVVAGAALALFLRSHNVKPQSSVPKSVSPIGSETPFLTRKVGASVSDGTSPAAASKHRAQGGLRSRFVALGVLIAAVFGSLTAKLWSMQVLSSERYVSAAQGNQFTTVKTPAPRGRIFDTEGIVLVDNKTTPTILADADVADNRSVTLRLSALLGIPHAVVRQRILDATGGAQAQREVSSSPRFRDVSFITEHPEAFPGITIEERAHRVYPYAALAGAVLGYTSTASEDAISNPPEGLEYESGDEVGSSGVEQAYESLLAGTHGERVVVADADGTVREVRSETAAMQGNDVHLTLSAKVQRIAEEEFEKLIAPDGVIGKGTGTEAALVAMEVDTGAVIAMANFPTFDPTHFVGGVSTDDWNRYTNQGEYKDKDSHNPLLNRCIAGAFPAASTFKAFTGMAGLHYGFADTGRTWDCEGTWTGWGDAYAQKCWLTTGHGDISFRDAVVVSCDTVFYEIAKNFYENGSAIGETAMQDYIKEYGFGSRTGIELIGEISGAVPTPEWKRENWSNAPELGQWQPGDMTNLVIGQGDVQITPLQLAVAYAGIATGSLPTPTLFKEARNSAGETVVSANPVVRGIADAVSGELDVMRDALRGVATEDAAVPDLFKEYGYECACKTGTGEWEGHDGYAWFAMYAPYDAPKYVVTCVVQEGGSGGSVAGPIAAKVMDACIKLGEGKLEKDIAPTAEITESVEYEGTGAGRVD